MTESQKPGKMQEIKETVSGAVEIIRQIRAPGMQDSLAKIMATGAMAKEIIEVLKTPEMVQNIENFRIMTENINEASTKIQSTVKLLEDSGVLSETKVLAASIKNTIDLFGVASQDMREVSNSVKAMFKSVQVLVSDLKN
jgi:predicted transcriptional regulator